MMLRSTRRMRSPLLVAMVLATAVVLASAQSTTEPWPDPSNYTNITPGFVPVEKPTGVPTCTKTLARISTATSSSSSSSSTGFFSAGSFPPPSSAADCPSSWSKIAMALEAQTEEREGYQRAVGVFIQGVEVMRVRMEWANTNKTYFRAEADITKYASIFHSSSPLPMEIAFDPPPSNLSHPLNVSVSCVFFGTSSAWGEAALGSTRVPDVVVPIVYDVATGKRWGEPALTTIVGDADVPPNPFKAQIEVYASRPPEDDASIITYGQVVVLIDNNAVGHAYAPNVEFTHAAVIPTFTLLASPFVGVLAESKPHNFSFRSPESVKVLVGANLLIWLAKGVTRTSGRLTLARQTPFFGKTLVDQPAPEEYLERGSRGFEYYVPAYAEAYTDVVTRGYVQVGSHRWYYSHGQLAVAHVFDNHGLSIYDVDKNRLVVESEAIQKRFIRGQDPVETDEALHTFINDHETDCHRSFCGAHFTHADTYDITNTVKNLQDPRFTTTTCTTFSHTYKLVEVTQSDYLPVTVLESGDYENDIVFKTTRTRFDPNRGYVGKSYCYNYTSLTHAYDEVLYNHYGDYEGIVHHTSTTVFDNNVC